MHSLPEWIYPSPTLKGLTDMVKPFGLQKDVF